MAIRNYYLGGPAWAMKIWQGELFEPGSKPGEFLRQYGSVLNTVEGNTTFYSTPKPEIVERWRSETPTEFRFCFKLPRRVTHDMRLRDGARGAAQHFLDRMQGLGDRLGPFFIQLPPAFAVRDLAFLEEFLASLPDRYGWAVEVRHPDWFGGGEGDEVLNSLLERLAMDRVIFDTRALREADPSIEAVAAAQGKKPNTDWRPIATGPRPFVRYCAHSDLGADDHYLEEWADRLAGWIDAGKTPYFFIHSPGDFNVPKLARRFHEMLAQRADVGELPSFPADRERQMGLFG